MTRNLSVEAANRTTFDKHTSKKLTTPTHANKKGGLAKFYNWKVVKVNANLSTFGVEK